MAKKFGQYLCVPGSMLKTKIPKNGIGHFVEYDAHTMYVINLSTRIIVGQYLQEDLAYKCAQFLHKADELKLSNEIDRMLGAGSEK